MNDDFEANDDEEGEFLLDLWARLEAPDPEDGDDQARDPATAATMAWLRSAWAELELPASPTSLPTQAPEGRLLHFAPALAALAAAVLVIVSVLAFHQSAPVEARPDRELAQQPVVEVRSEAITSRITPAGELEMRKGRVRLLLVASHSTSNSNSNSNDPTNETPIITPTAEEKSR